MNDLEGRVIAIAGVGGGLGPLVAKELGERGATVAGTDRSEETLAALGEELALGDRWDGQAVDLLDEEAVRAWCAALVARFGRVDGVVHLVGGWRGGQPLQEAPLEDWALLHDLLVRTVQHTTRAFHEQLAASRHGRFVLVSAKQAQAPSNTNAAYAAAKAAAEAWTFALSDEITANVVAVNAIVTPQMRAEKPDAKFATFTDVADIADAIALLLRANVNRQRIALYKD